MKVELSLLAETYIIIAGALQPVYNSKSHTRREKSTLSIALDVVAKVDSKVCSLKGKTSLFSQKKKVKLSLKHHEADMLELLLIDQIQYATEPYIKGQIQKTIDQLNQKLA
ncbi:hypothetical protein [Flavobacterium sp. N2820]|uniref:hypothetical protein n=1 Tax=Flavobacterium sp. N2820 TaxID=2986834 RepID=UPI0022246C7E|nr:hypothetical protein [Flavobacterium sp. N2820]